MIYIYFIPDGDTDAYAHHIIARDILANPLNIDVHWVWLPLFHYLQAGLIFLGSEMQLYRYLNVFIWIPVPVITYIMVKDSSRENTAALTAFFLTALSPIGLLMGTTAQPEPLFALLIILFVYFSEKNKFIISSVFLAAACLLRYEAWAVLGFTGLYLLWNYFIGIKNKTGRKDLLKPFLIIILPLVSVIVWTLIRLHFDGRLFTFLTGTQKFASDALQQSSSFSGGPLKVLQDLIHYPVWIPVMFMGINFVFVLFGIRETLQKHKSLVLSGTAILFFITLSWMMKSTLGLNRHFTAIVPFYGVMAGYGMGRVLLYSERKFTIGNLYNIVKKMILTVSGAAVLFYLAMWSYIWTDLHKSGFPPQKAAAEFLRTLPSDSKIICNDGIVEVLSGLDYRRFDHFWITDKPLTETEQYISQSAAENRNLFIIAKRQTIDILRAYGDVVFTSPENNKSGEIIYIIHAGIK